MIVCQQRNPGDGTAFGERGEPRFVVKDRPVIVGGVPGGKGLQKGSIEREVSTESDQDAGEGQS
jgi:hypothetical protein